MGRTLFGAVLGVALALSAGRAAAENLDEGRADGAFTKRGTAAETDATRPAGKEWEDAYQKRVNVFINAKTWGLGGLGDPDSGKRAWPAILAELYKVRDDAKATGRARQGDVPEDDAAHQTHAESCHRELGVRNCQPVPHRRRNAGGAWNHTMKVVKATKETEIMPRSTITLAATALILTSTLAGAAESLAPVVSPVPPLFGFRPGLETMAHPELLPMLPPPGMQTPGYQR